MLPIKLNKFYSHLSSYIARRLAKSRMRVAFCIHSIFLRWKPCLLIFLLYGLEWGGGGWLIEVMFPWTFLYKDSLRFTLSLFYNTHTSLSVFFLLSYYLYLLLFPSFSLSFFISFFLSFFLSFPLVQNKNINCCMESPG